MNNESALLEVQNLNVFFRKGRRESASDINVVNSLSFDVRRQEVFGLAGESGSGKSMTAYTIMGILPHNAYYRGNILFKGAHMSMLSDGDLRQLRGNKLAMIFQEPMTSLNPVLTIGYQIDEVLTTHKAMSRRQAREVTLRLLSEVQIPSPSLRVNDYPHQMSGGMRQRVMIAMAIACTPDIVIADEPTTALDVTIQAQIIGLLRTLKEEKHMSLLLITHDLAVIAENADRAAIMYAGRLMEMAPVSDLFRAPLHPYTIGLMQSVPQQKGKRLKPIPGMVPKPDMLPKGCKFSQRCAFVQDVCRQSEPQLLGYSTDASAREHLARCFFAGKL